jgi:uncharacterized membrane protein YbhN (UPF0104 family)
VVQTAISLAVVVAIFVFVLPQTADFSKVWKEIGAMTSLELATLALVGIWNQLTYAFVWMASLPGLSFGQGTVVSEAPSAVANTVPGGSYISIGVAYAMFASWGFKRSSITLALLVSGIWNNFAKLALPVLALVSLALTGRVTTARIAAGGAGIAGLLGAVVVFFLIFRTPATAARLGILAGKAISPFLRLIRKPPARGWDIAVTRFREKTVGLLSRRWHALTGATLVSHVSLYLVLLLTLRHIGVSEAEVSWPEVLAAFAFARLLTAIPLTPGGLGVVELALTTALVAAGGDKAQVVGAVLVYRGLTYVLTIPLGVICWGYWRRNTSWRRAPGSVSGQVEPSPAA